MLKNKVAIVTGAASGIGLATAEMLVQEGANIVMADVNEALLEDAASKIGASAFAADLSKRESCRQLVDFALKKYGKVDILVNVAGIQYEVLHRVAAYGLGGVLTPTGIATPEAVDDVMKYGLGMRYACLGPFEVCDLGGLDIFYNIASYLFADLADQKEPFGMLADRFEKGQYGVKSCAGFYDYSDGKDAEKIKYRDQMFTKLSKCLFG